MMVMLRRRRSNRGLHGKRRGTRESTAFPACHWLQCRRGMYVVQSMRWGRKGRQTFYVACQFAVTFSIM